MFTLAGVGPAFVTLGGIPSSSSPQLKGLLMSAEQKLSISKIDNSAPNTFK